jgi:hypothetical protein
MIENLIDSAQNGWHMRYTLFSSIAGSKNDSQVVMTLQSQERDLEMKMYSQCHTATQLLPDNIQD